MTLCDLRLMCSLNDVSNIPTAGKDLIIVADVDGALYFRVFDGDRMVVNTDEDKLAEKAELIQYLRKELEGLWPPHELTKAEKTSLSATVQSIVGHSRDTREHRTESGYRTRGVPDYQQGTRVGIYDLVQSLGRGGMGQVWKAHDTQGHRSVAIKLLPPEFRHNPEAIAQVRSAFQVVHQLNHPCLCKSLGLFEDAQHGPYIVMDYVEGITLSEYRRRFSGGRVPFEQVVSILGKVADALDHAHEKVLRTGDGETKGVLHRDVKPQNIMVLVEGDAVVQVSLIDLGLAAEIRSSTTRFTKARVDNRGTRPYMSPEQLSGKRSQWDGRTDQYSLAAVAYEMLGGHPPFEADDDLVLIQAIKDELPDPIDGLAPFINAALLKGLSKNRDDRFASCSDFIEALAGHAFGPDLAASGNIPLMAAPLIETITWDPALQVKVSELPPLPEDILGLEGRLSGLQVAIDLIDQGKHHEIRAPGRPSSDKRLHLENR